MFLLAGRYANTSLDFFYAMSLSEAALVVKDITEIAQEEKRRMKQRRRR